MMALGLPCVSARGSLLYYLWNWNAINQTTTSKKRNIAVSLFSFWLIARVLSFSKYALDLCMRDAINTLSLWVQFVSMDTPALDHVDDGPFADFEHFGGLACG